MEDFDSLDKSVEFQKVKIMDYSSVAKKTYQKRKIPDRLDSHRISLDMFNLTISLAV